VPPRATRSQAVRQGTPARPRRVATQGRWFLARFAVLAVIFGLAQLLFPEWTLAAADLLARGVAGTLTALGWHASTRDLLVSFDGGAFIVGGECTGLGIVGFVAAFCLAYPASWAQRAWGFGLAALTILAANFVRLVACAAIDVYAPRWSAPTHDYVWQVGMIGIALVLVRGWTRWVTRAQGAGAGAGSGAGAGATRASSATNAGSLRSTSNSGSARR
jgi:exosortase/archaeosortase family protein